MNQNQNRVNKRKKYLELNASEQEKVVPRTSKWRGSNTVTVNQENQLADLQEKGEQIQEVEDAIEARDQTESVDNTDNLSNSDEQAHDNFIWEQCNVNFLHFEDEDDDLGNVSGEDTYVSQEDVENDHTFNSNSLADNLKNYDSPLFENSPTTISETLQMVMMHAMKHKLTWTAVEDMLKMINTILGQSVLPQTKYAFNKIFGTADSMTFHFYCTDCSHYLKKYDGHLNANFDKKNSNMMSPNPKCKKNSRCEHLKTR